RSGLHHARDHQGQRRRRDQACRDRTRAIPEGPDRADQPEPRNRRHRLRRHPRAEAAMTTETAEGRVDFDFRLDGKVALVTGGAAGIGAAIATAYATKGARIAVVDINETAAVQTTSGLPTESRGFHCDVADPDSVRGTVDAVRDVFGRVDILVNSAGVV